MIVLFVKRLAAILLSDSNNLIMFETVLTKTENVLSSAK